MASKRTRSERGAERARLACIALSVELRDARLSAGLSQMAVARAAGLSSSQISRLERGGIRRPSVDQLSRFASAVGRKVSIRLYPDDAAPVRDEGQLALLARFETRLPRPLAMEREVPLPIQGDQRAWDGRLMSMGRACAVEGEVHLHDMQDLARRIALKLRDDPIVDRLILLVARSAHNRRVLREHREALRSQFPLDGAAILAALRRGMLPQASGILML